MTLVLAAAARSTRIAMEKNNNKKTVADLIVNANEVSRIADGAIFKGDLSSQNDIRIDGEVEGTVFSRGRIVVGEKARIHGKLLCAVMDFQGMIVGDLYVSDLLSVKSTAIINGNISVSRLQVETGAQFNGNCRKIDPEEFEKDSKSIDLTLEQPVK